MSDGAVGLLTATTVPRMSGRDRQDERMRECAKDASMSDDFEAQRLCVKSAVMSTGLEECGSVRRLTMCGGVRRLTVCGGVRRLTMCGGVRRLKVRSESARKEALA